jgi:hypothetical protein
MAYPQASFAFATIRSGVRCANSIVHALASIRVAVALIVLFAIAVVGGLILEGRHGREYSQWYVFDTVWYVGLLGLLAGSVFSAAYVRFPWKLRQIGFVITHVGLLLLIGGAILSYFRRIEGRVELVEGQATSELLLTDRSQITARWADHPGERPYIFSFAHGPVDWKSGTSLDIGSVDGVSARVLNYYQQSESVQNWTPDQSRRAGPLIRLELEGPKNAHAAAPAQEPKPITALLVDQDYGAELFAGPIAIRLQRATSAAMLADFLHPTEKDLGKKGMLTAYYMDTVEHVPVDSQVGKAVQIGKTGAKVELVQYLSNGKLDRTGRFQPVGTEVKNPLVELKVELAGDEQIYRQVAFAKSPLLNFDGIYPRPCPVKFTYEHPQFKPSAAIEFLQATDGKLYGRTLANGKSKTHGELTRQSRLPLEGGFVVTIKEYMPHAKCDVSFKPSDIKSVPDPLRHTSAAKLEIEIGGTKKTLWLQRNSPEFQIGTIDLPEGTLRAQFTADRIPLGFELKLENFHHEKDREGHGTSRYCSTVAIADCDGNAGLKQLVTAHEPLCYSGYRIFQSSYADAGHGEEASILRVYCDPGRPFKYLGNCTICAGIAVMFAMRRLAASSRPNRPFADS